MNQDDARRIQKALKLCELEPSIRPEGINFTILPSGTSFFFGDPQGISTNVPWSIVEQLFLASMLRFIVMHDMSFGVVVSRDMYAVVGAYGAVYAKTLFDALIEACQALRKIKTGEIKLERPTEDKG
jgi:hypothetical protein